MHVWVTQHAVERYLQRIEGLPIEETRRPVARARAAAAIRGAFEPVAIRYLPTVSQVLLLPPFTAVLQGSYVVTVVHPGDRPPGHGVLWNFAGRPLRDPADLHRLAVGLPA